MSQFQNDAIFWVEIEKVRPNPYQPRTNFDEARLKDLADSIRQYGVLQPLVVTRHEEEREDGGLSTYYELIAGERRLRAAKLAGLMQIPVIIRSAEEHDRMKLELAIIENLQREDLNAIDRARAFERLAKEFSLSNTDIAKKIGKSREYVSNTLRLLNLPSAFQEAVAGGGITEGHARALLMLTDRPQEQETVFRDILLRKLSVREVEKITREIAVERTRKNDLRPEITALERAFSERLGTRVEIKEKEVGGRLIINFLTTEELQDILLHVSGAALGAAPGETEPRAAHDLKNAPIDDRSLEEVSASDESEDSFSVEKFSI